jgi:RimJ/RimL family protein N-acetyltransferase
MDAMSAQPTLQTTRLVLRPMTLADAARVQELVSDRAIADTTAVIPHPYPVGAAAEWIATGPLGLHRVEATHFTRNPASGRVIEKLAMRPEGIFREAFRRWGRYEDIAQRAILADEWAARGPVPIPPAR